MTVAGPLEFRLRQMLPLLTMLGAALLDLAPIPNAAPGSRSPDLTMAVLFFWTLHRPELVPPGGVFAIALASDLVAGSMIGLTPATLLVMREAVLRQHKLLLTMSSAPLWAAFGLYAAMAALLRWIASSVLLSHWQAPLLPMATVVLTVLFWPLVVLVLARVQSFMPRVRHAAGG